MHDILEAHLLECLQKKFLLHLRCIWQWDACEVGLKCDSLDAIAYMFRQLSGEHIFEFNHRLEKKLALEVLIVAIVVDIYQTGVVNF